MTTKELQDAYCPPSEEMTPIRDVVAMKLRSMMHAYLNGVVPAVGKAVKG